MPEDPITLLRYLLFNLWRQRWLILAVAWFAALLGWVAVAALPDRYTAKAQIFVDTDSILGPLMTNLAVAPDVQGQVQMMRQTLLSRPNLEVVAREAGLLTDDGTPRDKDMVLKHLQKEIEVRPLDATLLQVSYKAGSPRLAFAVVQHVLDLFVEENQGHTRRDVDSARAFIDGQIAEYEAKLRHADLALAQFKREHAEELVGTDRAQRDLDDARSGKKALESELSSAEWQRDQLELQRASAPVRIPRADVVQGPSPAEAQFESLQSDLNRLLLVYTDRHPDVVNLRRLADQARVALETERREQTVVNTLPNPLVAQLDEQLRGLDLRIADLKRRIGLAGESVGELARKAADTPAVEADLLRLTRDYDALSKNYQELVQRRETANLAKEMDAKTRSVEFRVVDPPVVPASPSGPWRGALTVAVALVALGIGIALALLRIMLRRTIDRPEQLLASFEIPVAGVVREVRLRRSQVGARIETALACTIALMFFVGVGGLLHRNTIEPLKIDLIPVVDRLSTWVGVDLASALPADRG
jgi:polysaccharide chain length determinant protein (PEP-CTERM system associated)